MVGGCTGIWYHPDEVWDVLTFRIIIVVNNIERFSRINPVQFLNLFNIFWRTHVLFVGPLIPLFWTSGQIRFPGLHVSSSVCNWFLRFTSVVTPADLSAARMASEPLHLHICVQVLMMLESRINPATASQHVTRHTLYRLSYTASTLL